MIITTSKTETDCIMLFWISDPKDPYSTVPITFKKKHGADEYTVCKWSEDYSLNDVIELLRDYIPNIAESLRIDEELETMLKLKYETFKLNYATYQ